MTVDRTTLEADLTWMDGAFRTGVRCTIAGGRFESVEEWPETRDDEEGDDVTRLEGVALLPGLVNAHSHAFQRGLRGLGEIFPEGAGSFWTWREAMYSLVESLDPERVYELTAQAYREMLAAGITTVGEFHYIRHADIEKRDCAFDDAVIAAAADAGIRLVLMPAHYRWGGFGADGPTPLAGGQRRFDTLDPVTYWRQFDRLAARVAQDRSGRVTLGAVAHSVRAVAPGEMAEMIAESRRRGLTLHLHLEEQRREIEDALAAWGTTPLGAMLNRTINFDAVTAVHCTHSAPDEITEYLTRGGRICLCPLTEGNLGDGIADVTTMLTAPGATETPGRICLGTDSNARIAMLEEIRWTELVQRLANERRGVVRDDEGRTAEPLLDLATTNGAAALGLDVGRVAPGAPADLIEIDLNAPELAGCTEETLLPALVYGAGNKVIAGTRIAGTRLDGRAAG